MKSFLFFKKYLRHAGKKGFTLIEMLVATAIFTSVMIVAAGALVSIVSANTKAQAIKSVIDNVTFAVDSISRNLRNASNYSCLGLSGNNVNNASCSSSGNAGISYEDPTGAYDEYVFVPTASITSTTSVGNIQEATNCGGPDGCDTLLNSFQSITAPVASVNVSSMLFTVYGDGNTEQPRVIIAASGYISLSTKVGATTTEFDLQTSASQRSRND